jgi:uncharacterized alpha-E superfamily protein
MSRYLERAEHTARLIGVHLDLMLDQTAAAASSRRERLAASLSTPLPEASLEDDYSMTQALTFNLSNKSSIVACIAAARENAQNVREQISSEMWEQINQLYLSVRQTGLDKIWRAEPHRFFRAIKEGAHLFQGLTDSTMNHGEGWHFIQVGRYIERAGAVAALLDVHYRAFSQLPRGAETPDGHLEWIGLLRSCTAFEAYCKVYTADFQPKSIAEFLLLNHEFPHSIYFAVDMIQTALHGIAEVTEMRKVGRVYRLVGRLRASFDFDQIDEIMAADLHTYLQDIQAQCWQIHEALYQAYITYPIEAALAVEGR